MTSRRTKTSPKIGRGLGHVTSTIFGSTVGYPSDSLPSGFKDMFDRMPKIVGVTLSRPRPLLGKIILFVRPLGIPHTELHTKFEVSSSKFSIVTFALGRTL